jgi:tRNA threonylcarbamoyl adenosine modification protein (Sua5/YciO/YrdC/YwlC family)
MIIKIHPESPSLRQIQHVVEVLKEGGIIIYPTDTIYGLGCDITNHKAVERIAQLKGVNPEKVNFSFICYDLSHLSDYTKPIDNDVYRLMKKHLPGPYTFILEANNKVPKLFQSRKKTVGIRIPDNHIPRELVRELGNPVMSTSIHDDDTLLEYTTDPELIYEKYKNLVDIVIDGGVGGNLPSTVVDCTGNEIKVLRQGRGVIEF